MKFTWFNLMPWPYLPDDFREKNRSVWVDIDQALFDLYELGKVTYEDALRNADSVNDLRLQIKLNSERARSGDLSSGTEHLTIV